MVDGDQLGDEASHRGADDVRGADAEGVQQAHGIVGHVVEPVRRLRVAAERCRHVGVAGVLHIRRQAGVPVVEADDAESAIRQLRAKVVVPADHLSSQAHDQQKRLAGGVSERLVLELDSIPLGSRHKPMLEARPTLMDREPNTARALTGGQTLHLARRERLS